MMGTTLTQVLTAVENTNGPLSLNQLADQLGVSRGLLEDMLQFWVRKDRIRVIEAGAEANCSCCAAKTGCSLVAKMPKRYEVIDVNAPAEAGTDIGFCCEVTKAAS